MIQLMGGGAANRLVTMWQVGTPYGPGFVQNFTLVANVVTHVNPSTQTVLIPIPHILIVQNVSAALAIKLMPSNTVPTAATITARGMTLPTMVVGGAMINPMGRLQIQENSANWYMLDTTGGALIQVIDLIVNEAYLTT